MPDPDCEHLFVEWEPYQIDSPHYTDRVTTVHWFTCQDCPVRANVVHNVHIDQP
jgi:hypothetical protein